MNDISQIEEPYRVAIDEDLRAGPLHPKNLAELDQRTLLERIATAADERQDARTRAESLTDQARSAQRVAAEKDRAARQLAAELNRRIGRGT